MPKVPLMVWFRYKKVIIAATTNLINLSVVPMLGFIFFAIDDTKLHSHPLGFMEQMLPRKIYLISFISLRAVSMKPFSLSFLISREAASRCMFSSWAMTS